MLIKPYRAGIGGIAIESSTFSPHLSTLADFTIFRGQQMLPHYPFLPGWRFQNRDDVTWLPCLHARAIPGGPVSADDYGAMKGELLDRVCAVLPLDGFFFDVHGAMFVEGMEDAEADLAAAIRHLVGPRCLVSTGQDLHGNVSARLVDLLDVFTAHRLAPHDDELLTRERACALLLKCLDDGIRPQRAWTRIPAILPGERTSTLVEPGKTVYARLAESDGQPLDVRGTVTALLRDDPVGGDIVAVRSGGVQAVVTSRRKPYHYVRDLLALGLSTPRRPTSPRSRLATSFPISTPLPGTLCWPSPPGRSIRTSPASPTAACRALSSGSPGR